MIDVSQAGPAVLVLGSVAMVLDREGANLGPAGLNIRDRIGMLIVHDIAGVVADLKSFVADLTHDPRAMGAGCGVAAVLLDDDRHAVPPRYRRHLLQVAQEF